MIWTGHGCWRKGCETPSVKTPSVCSQKIFPPRFCYVWVFMCESVCFTRCRSFWTFTSVISVVSILPQTFPPSDFYWKRITMASWIRIDEIKHRYNWQHSTLQQKINEKFISIWHWSKFFFNQRILTSNIHIHYFSSLYQSHCLLYR